MKLHVLKTDPIYFEQVWKGLKTSELRFNDREFKQSDSVLLREYIREGRTFTGRSVRASITYVTDYPAALRKGFVMLSLNAVNQWIFKNNDETFKKGIQ